MAEVDVTAKTEWPGFPARPGTRQRMRSNTGGARLRATNDPRRTDVGQDIIAYYVDEPVPPVDDRSTSRPSPSSDGTPKTLMRHRPPLAREWRGRQPLQCATEYRPDLATRGVTLHRRCGHRVPAGTKSPGLPAGLVYASRTRAIRRGLAWSAVSRSASSRVVEVMLLTTAATPRLAVARTASAHDQRAARNGHG